jgi:hypothetical protein
LPWILAFSLTTAPMHESDPKGVPSSTASPNYSADVQLIREQIAKQYQSWSVGAQIPRLKGNKNLHAIPVGPIPPVLISVSVVMMMPVAVMPIAVMPIVFTGSCFRARATWQTPSRTTRGSILVSSYLLPDCSQKEYQAYVRSPSPEEQCPSSVLGVS